ncbi:MAG: hypothetical protein C0407_11640 [Desulfobacca sp.]|nr:hypothetical protein [Desulfobacca sp.]
MRLVLVSIGVLIFLLSANTGQTNFSRDLACHRGLSTDCLRTQRANPNGILPSGARLHRGESIWAPSGEFHLSCQNDGNLVLYRQGAPVWSSGTYGREVRECVMQTDGNLVLYGQGHQPVWATNTPGNPGAFLAVQDDGNVVIYRPAHPVWASGSNR